MLQERNLKLWNSTKTVDTIRHHPDQFSRNCTFSFPSFADDNIDNLKGQTSALESELDGINKDILSLSEEISATEMQVEILNGEIARTSDALVEAEENENEQYENMKSRIKYMYEHGNATLLEMLFSAENMADFINKADFIENLSEYDKTALDDLKKYL